MGKHYSDRERLDAVKKYRISGLRMSEFVQMEGYNRSTFKDWVNAYEFLQGDFIRIDNIEDQPGALLDEENIKLNLLKTEEIAQKSGHFTRFDHSLVVIETKQVKITTSLAQALKIIEVIYDRL